MTVITVRHGLPEHMRVRGAELVMHAATDEFLGILGSEKASLALIEGALAKTLCLTAEKDGELVGLLTLGTSEAPALDITMDDLKQHFSWVMRGLRAWLLEELMNTKVHPGSLYVYTIAVDPAHSGQGIGSQLFDALEAYADEQLIDCLQLKVTTTNVRAQALYQRRGYSIVKTINIRPWDTLLGLSYNADYLMERQRMLMAAE
ncbi:GNAT family N-acetyltransferase [Pseudovibrio flavus]|uniref:GNAT family N-acetyltransferase n=1 Tax=Pseudovibrio flavus TaxID=2529854 RepID=UPI00211C78BB|nr:N-acetyltransferase [Pseudovibrio flavus]